MTIITTHYSELKSFAYEHEGMENASVEFDPVTLKPTYRLLMGIPGSSNAFYISRRLGLPEEILAQAESLIGQEHANMENVLQNLEGERRQYERRNTEIENLRLEAEHLKNELLKKKNDLDKRRNETLRKAREDADELYRNSRKESSAILKELRAMKNLVDTAKVEELAEMARKGLNKSFALEGQPVPEGQGLAAGNAAVGKNVYLKTLGQTGVIVEIKGSQVIVQVGSMRTTVPMKSCLLVREGRMEAQNKQSRLRRLPNQRHDMFVKKAQTTTTEIDVRGRTVDEAIPFVDKAIDDALLAGMEYFRLIHGKGTGMLRAGLTDYLKANRAVKRIEMAPQNEGGAGATIVYI
jgi:DNA mismatch repair protein MutS2